MIPTMILFGLVLGRWWKSAIAAGAVVWPAILVLAALGAANTAAGVAVHQAALRLVRSIRRDRPAPSSS